MLIAKCALTHIGQFDGAFGTGVHKPIATYRMELCSRDDFREFLHVGRFDVNNVETLVLDIEIPQVNT